MRHPSTRSAVRKIGELQVHQPDLGAGEGHGADHLEHPHAAPTGQPGDQNQPPGIWEGQVLLNQSDLNPEHG